MSEYLRELDAIIGRPFRGHVEALKYYEDTISAHGTEWIWIQNAAQSETIGFLIIGTAPNCHPDADFYVQEAYIKPECRTRGYMTKTVTSFIKAHRGVYCLFVLNNNKPAYRFWMNIFTKMQYMECELRDVGAGDETCTQYGFRPIS